MSPEEQEQPRRRDNPRQRYPEVSAMLDDLEELSSITPAELRRYAGQR